MYVIFLLFVGETLKKVN